MGITSYFFIYFIKSTSGKKDSFFHGFYTIFRTTKKD